MSVRLSQFDPKLLDFVTWVIVKGCRLFQRIHITPNGLLATERIPENDFVAIVPVGSTLSIFDVVEDIVFPLKVSPFNYSNAIHFFQDLTRGDFVFISFLTKILVTGSPRGMKMYLDILPCNQKTSIDAAVNAAQTTEGYQESIRALLTQCKASRSDFDAAFKHAYCLYRRHAIPFWVSHGTWGTGHPYFQNSDFTQAGTGNIMGMVPVLDLALHSPTPNASIGYPDQEMLLLISQHKKMRANPKDNYFIMQALRDIEKGEMITTDKNVHFNFDDDTFKKRFGFSNASQVSAESNVIHQKITSDWMEANEFKNIGV
ncbi:unnamed protein product [Phytomonas sp. Hart1]|nr:unnamed protein product [Phytomonas sp. Hart1]|eukprot:CCW68894.1 unnamed protein product [Phytomonas sp. isolate Hart1]